MTEREAMYSGDAMVSNAVMNFIVRFLVSPLAPLTLCEWRTLVPMVLLKPLGLHSRPRLESLDPHSWILCGELTLVPGVLLNQGALLAQYPRWIRSIPKVDTLEQDVLLKPLGIHNRPRLDPGTGLVTLFLSDEAGRTVVLPDGRPQLLMPASFAKMEKE
jgi:hypothetical protein